MSCKAIKPYLSFILIVFCIVVVLVSLRDWRQRADEKLGHPPPKVQPGAFNGQRQGQDPREDLLVVHCFCLCRYLCTIGGEQLHGT